jgi:hypothetical protein
MNGKIRIENLEINRAESSQADTDRETAPQIGKRSESGVQETRDEKRAEKTWLESLKARLNLIFRGEKELPPLHFDILYAPHGTAEDWNWASFQEHLQRADIYIPEIYEWHKRTLKYLNEISRGEVPPPKVPPGVYASWDITLIKAIYDSQKPVLAIDVPSGHRIVALYRKLKSRLKNLRIESDFSVTLYRFKSLLMKEGHIQKEREEYMLSQLKPVITKFLRKNPNFYQKDKINVLLTLGSIHTDLYHELKRGGGSVSREFPEMPYSFDFASEAVRRARFELEISNDLAAKALLECFLEKSLGRFIGQLTNSTDKAMLFIRLLASQFTFEEIRDLFGKADPEGKNFADLFLSALHTKDIKFPTSPVKLDAFLAKFKKLQRLGEKR